MHIKALINKQCVKQLKLLSGGSVHRFGLRWSFNHPRAREHLFVLVVQKIDLRYFNRDSATCFRNFSQNKVLITFRNVRGLQETNSNLSRTVTCRATLLSERVLISRTILRLLRFVVLCKNEVKNQNSAL